MIDGRYPTSVINIDIVHKIKEDLIQCETILEVYDKYSNYISHGQIAKINAGKSWYEDGYNYPLTSHFLNSVFDEDIEKIIQEIQQSNKTLKQIGDEFGYCKSTIVNINNGNRKKYKISGYTYPIRKNNRLLLSLKAKEIRQSLLNDSGSCKDIAKKFGVSESSVIKINQGEIYKDDSLQYPLREAYVGPKYVSKEKADEIRKLLIQTNLPMSQIAKKFTVSEDIVYGINSGETQYLKNDSYSYPLRK